MRIEYREGLGWIRVKRGRGKRVAPPVLEDPRVAYGRRVAPKTGAAGEDRPLPGLDSLTLKDQIS